MIALLRATALVLATAVSASAGAAPTEPSGVAQAFVEAWNAHDVGQFRELFTEDAEWVPVVETRLSGRAQVIADLEVTHQSWASRTTLAASDVATTKLAEGSAVVLFRAGFLGKDGQRIEPANALMLVVVQDRTGWRIKAGQLSKPGATAMPANR